MGGSIRLSCHRVYYRAALAYRSALSGTMLTSVIPLRRITHRGLASSYLLGALMTLAARNG